MTDKLGREELLNWLITAMSHMKTIYEDNGIPWSEDEEVSFRAAYKCIEQQKSQVTEEWYEEKAERLDGIIIEMFPTVHYHIRVGYRLSKFKDFIRSLYEEIQCKK